MIEPTIAFINRSSVTLKPALAIIVEALKIQLEKHFGPAWGVSAKLYAVADGKDANPGEWQVVFLDDADAASVFGYHLLTKDGQPVSKVFMMPIREAKESESMTASHELLEMLIDPGAQLWAQASTGVQHAYEVCDAVENEMYTITINDVKVSVSDFVYPSFYEYWHAPNSGLDEKARTQFDYLNKVSRPFQTLRRGYQIVSIRGAIAEEFGSPNKQAAFLNEDRTMHRSEYRIARTAAKALMPLPSTNDNPFCPGGYIPGRFANAADRPLCKCGYIPGRSGPLGDSPFCPGGYIPGDGPMADDPFVKGGYIPGMLSPLRRWRT